VIIESLFYLTLEKCGTILVSVAVGDVEDV
jgi:hypothetical protein